jgi:hypothetical protein
VTLSNAHHHHASPSPFDTGPSCPRGGPEWKKYNNECVMFPATLGRLACVVLLRVPLAHSDSSSSSSSRAHAAHTLSYSTHISRLCAAWPRIVVWLLHSSMCAVCAVATTSVCRRATRLPRPPPSFGGESGGRDAGPYGIHSQPALGRNREYVGPHKSDTLHCLPRHLVFFGL